MTRAAQETTNSHGNGTAQPPIANPETPSGKGAGDENFPVGSFLLPAHLRPHVAAFYALVRAGDDIADNPDLEAQDKIDRLDALQAALKGEPGYGTGYEKAHRLRASLDITGVTDRHACDLLSAFRQDAEKSRYANWQELLGYCELSANPVGRFLLDLHGEENSGYVYSDGLCTILQIINHVQDCADDYKELDRVYIPQDWMTAHGVSVVDLASPASNQGLRAVLDQILAGVDHMLPTALKLPAALKNRRLAMESSTIIRLAVRLTARLKRQDPWTERVDLTKVDFALSGLAGIAQGLFGSRPQ